LNIPSLEFLLGLFLLVAVFHALPSATWRRILLTCCNLAFVWFTLPNAQSRLALVLFALSGYVAGRLLQVRPRTAIFSVYITLLVAVFLVLKKYELIGAILPAHVMDHPVVAVGLSYMLFRQIHFLVDVMQQQIPRFSLRSYLNYQFNLFGFISGPIQRYEDFGERWQHMQPLLLDRYEVLRAYLRIFIGVIKVSLISVFLLNLYESQHVWFLLPTHAIRLGRAKVLAKFITYFYSYLPYLYFNFSGYCDIVIAGASLVSIKMPENFDRPYLSRNVSDYWTRFHQSLGFWVRDYLFTPMYKSLATRWSQHAQLLVYPCYLIAFIIAGLWHGSTLNFAIFGLIHGVGVSAGKAWEYWIIKRHGRKGLKTYLASRPIRIAAILVTLHFVAFSMLFFPQSVQSTMTTLRNFIHNMAA
jgi:D-alanyl-lipoteichoic acid acyltransferase DltB (MBOAT superfamily)